jgi:putative membrane protein
LTLLAAAHAIVHVNAALNGLATLLLLLGLFFIKRGRVEAHKRTMLTAFAVSVAFLACYLWYHWQVGRVDFTYPGFVRYIYLVILATHVVLAAIVPFLAMRQIYLGFRALGCCEANVPEPERLAVSALYRKKHVRLAKWTFPIWLYVSVTGVIVYVMLYHLWPPVGQ